MQTTITIQATVVAVLGILGAVIKHLIPAESINRWIPVIVLPCGIALYAALNHDWQVETLIDGLLTAASAIGLHQTLKQSTGKNI